jgi:hypothetical protein
MSNLAGKEIDAMIVGYIGSENQHRNRAAHLNHSGNHLLAPIQLSPFRQEHRENFKREASLFAFAEVR